MKKMILVLILLTIVGIIPAALLVLMCKSSIFTVIFGIIATVLITKEIIGG